MQGNRVRFQVDTHELDEAIGALHRIGLRTLVSQPPTLEELFLRHYGDVVQPERSDGEEQ